MSIAQYIALVNLFRFIFFKNSVYFDEAYILHKMRRKKRMGWFYVICQQHAGISHRAKQKISLFFVRLGRKPSCKLCKQVC